jgi:hypothetical protein
MIQRVLEAVSFLFLTTIGTPGGVGMIFVVSLLFVFRWMLRDKDGTVATATHS